MPNYLITYDLASRTPDAHKPFLTAAEKQGLLYIWKGAEYVSRLPNTTIWGVFASSDAAIKAFDLALSTASKAVGYNIALEKRCVTLFQDASVS